MNVDITFNPTLLNGSWQEAQQTDNGQLEVAPPHRGGRMSIDFKGNGEISWNGALNCGFGSRKMGAWELTGQQLSFTFNREQGYINRQLDQPMKEKINYRIEKLEAKELIFTDGEGKKFFFVKKD